MSGRGKERLAAADWERSAGRSLHRAGERTAIGIATQFRPSSMLMPGVAPGAEPEGGRIDGKVLNVRPDPVDFRDIMYQASLVELPTRLIPKPLSELGLTVRDQGNEGSCTGQALAAVIDLQNTARLREGANVPARVSARMLYESARACDEYPDDDLPGSSVRGVIKGFFHRGVCGADLAPYFPGDIGWRLNIEQAKEARRVTLGAYFRLRHALNDYHSALVEVRGLLCSSMVHDGWSQEKVRAAGGIIRSPGGNPKTVELSGAHAFAIIGFVPEGFIILNSWGSAWGGYSTDLLGGVKGASLSGMALWPYDEWCEHALDTWVLRLQVPANLPSGFVGGYHLVSRPTDREDPFRPSSPSSVSGIEIVGHFVNIADGVFVSAPPYENDKGTFEETAQFLSRNEDAPAGKRYDHLLLYAHGGLNELDAAAARAAAMTPVFKQNGVYPVFFLWHTGLSETASDLLRRLFEGVAARSGGFTDFSDILLENSSRPFGLPVWREMKADARRSFTALSGARGGDAWVATSLLTEAAVGRKTHPLRIHLVGHSAGAIFLGEMLARARHQGSPLAQVVATISLFAPACTNESFEEALAPMAPVIAARRHNAFTIYHLGDDDERNDSDVGLYRKSLLYLVSNAFEETSPTPLAGMEVHRQAWPGVEFIRSEPNAPRNSPTASRSRTHGEFDNDPLTMNHVLARILKQASITEREGGFSEADLVGRGF